eukprot:SAG31_NODE_520_length_14616_cov_8.879005_8_plen_85_part_00
MQADATTIQMCTPQSVRRLQALDRHCAAGAQVAAAAGQPYKFVFLGGGARVEEISKRLRRVYSENELRLVTTREVPGPSLPCCE